MAEWRNQKVIEHAHIGIRRRVFFKKKITGLVYQFYKSPLSDLIHFILFSFLGWYSICPHYKDVCGVEARVNCLVWSFGCLGLREVTVLCKMSIWSCSNVWWISIRKALPFIGICHLPVKWCTNLLVLGISSTFSLRNQPTFRNATSAFPAKWCLRNECRNSILMTCHYPDLGSASDWLKQIYQAAWSIRRTTPMWVETCHQYGISALV